MGRFDERAGLSRRGRDLTENDGGADGAPADIAGDASGDAGVRRHDEGGWHDGRVRHGGKAWHDGGAWPDRGIWPDGGGWPERGRRREEWLHGLLRVLWLYRRLHGRRAGRIFLYAEAFAIGIFLIWSAIAMLVTVARAISRLL